jgi:hypothetical protein
MVSFGVDKPADFVLFAFGTATAGACEMMRWRRVDGEGEEILGFGIVGDETTVEDEVNEDEDVHKENEEQNYDPGFGSVIHPSRCILLGRYSGVEILVLMSLDDWIGVILLSR